MASKSTAVGKGDAAENAYDRVKLREGYKAITKATRTMKQIPNPNPAQRKFKPYIFVPKNVDLFNCFDRIYARDDELEFAQVTDRSNLSTKKKKIADNFPVLMANPKLHITIPLWHKEKHGKVERFVFDIIEWVYSPDLKKMVFVERKERSK